MPSASERYSKYGRRRLATRVTSAYAVLTLGFMGVTAWGLVAQRSSASDAAAMRTGYLPLALALRDLVSAQDTYNSQLNYVTTAENPADKRVWFEKAIELGRPKGFGELKTALARAFWGGEPGRIGDSFLEQQRGIEVFLAEDSKLLAQLFLALDNHEQQRAEELRDELVTRGSAARKRLGELELRVQQHLDQLLDLAKSRERRAFFVFVFSAGCAFLAAVALALYVRRLLRPLTRVIDRAEAVGGGDLRPGVPIESEDEIGELSRTFENMVGAIARANKELLTSERLATIGKMAAHVTHEIRNPLSSLALNLELLEEELPEDKPEAHAIYRAVKLEVERLAALSERYLSVARRSELRLEEENLGHVIGLALAEQRSELERHRITCSLDVASGLPLVAIDAAQLRQVFFNLLRNAREAMPDGGHVGLQLRAVDSSPASRPAGSSGVQSSAPVSLPAVTAPAPGVELWVEDRGPGIDLVAESRLFEPFFTTKGHGTGLGLVISREIVEAHGGHISCERIEPQGTRFRVWLPVGRFPSPSFTDFPSGRFEAKVSEAGP